MEVKSAVVDAPEILLHTAFVPSKLNTCPFVGAVADKSVNVEPLRKLFDETLFVVALIVLFVIVSVDVLNTIASLVVVDAGIVNVRTLVSSLFIVTFPNVNWSVVAFSEIALNLALPILSRLTIVSGTTNVVALVVSFTLVAI